MTPGRVTTYRDESGEGVNIKDFERLLSGHHLQMRMSYDDAPDSRVQTLAIQRNFVGAPHLRPILLELFKTDETGYPIGDPILEWVTNYPFKICKELTAGLVDNVWSPELTKFATVINPHPQW